MKKYYNVGDHTFMLRASDDCALELANYETFECEPCLEEELLFNLTVGDFSPQAELETIGDFDDDNAHIAVHKISGGYSFRIAMPGGGECCVLQTNSDYSVAYARLSGSAGTQHFGLNNALMMLYAFASARHATLLLHASVVEDNGRGYLFLGKSGTGKSTHSRLWLTHIAGSRLLNDDNPVVRILAGRAQVYGSPWSGKTACYINHFVPIGAIVRLQQKPENRIVRNRPVQAFAAVMPSCSSARWDEVACEGVNDTLTQIAEAVPVFTLSCLPNKAAAELCFNTVKDE